mgnify:CR=1 FL=1
MNAIKNTKKPLNKCFIYFRTFIALFLIVYTFFTNTILNWGLRHLNIEQIHLFLPATALLSYFVTLIGLPFKKQDYMLLLLGLYLMFYKVSLPNYIYVLIAFLGCVCLLQMNYKHFKNNNKEE